MGLRVYKTVVDDRLAGLRLDRAVATAWEGISRKQAQRIIQAGGCYLDTHRCRIPASPVAVGMHLEICHDPDRDFTVWRLDPRRIVHEDHHLLVVNKPSGLPVGLSRSGQEGCLLDAVEAYLVGCDVRHTPELIHRLDQPTSGLVVFGKNHQTERYLSGLFRRRQVQKAYLAVVSPAPSKSAGVIDFHLADGRVDGRGKTARTRYRVLGRALDVALLHVTPETGRFHQIRIHLAHSGCPVVGDTRYGGERHQAGFGLHAWRLEFTDETGGRLAVEAPPPAEWIEAWPELLSRLTANGPA